ncbi:titin-like [Stylophora pistillata]|uniref:Hemicentin-2 n=1 Tax=Stylophora pistillata TaxID=50429 RepID=A0A2B4S0S4_STYPI|nr:titin-like [Stylophora pistillata]PFX22649.1 Hemicentin-2 [Stylophora pistillata]
MRSRTILRLLLFVKVILLLTIQGKSDKEYALTGTTILQAQRGELVTIKGYYKYCLTPSFYCPTCVRQVYLNLFNMSICLATIRKSQLDCQEKHFSQTYTAPSVGGAYEIKMEEILDFNCLPNRKSNAGSSLGTVLVEEPPTIAKGSSSLFEVVTGDSLTLQCSVRGYPSPAVRWYKDDSKQVHNDTSLEFSSIKQSDAGLYTCNASNVAGSDSRVVKVLVRERRPIIKQAVSICDDSNLFQNDLVTFTVILSHDFFSRDIAFDTLLVWTLPYYASMLSHVPLTNVSNPYPGEYNIKIGEIQPVSSKQINITVQIDPKRVLSVGKYFLSVPSFILYEQRMANDAAKMFVSSIQSVTINFTVREDAQRGFLLNPLSDEVYLCQEKKSDLEPSCYFSNDGVQWIGLDPRVKMISGMTVRGLYQRIFAVATDNRCHVVSGDKVIWTGIMPEEWKRESFSRDFVPAILVPGKLESDLPEHLYIATKTDGSVSYGASAKGLHKKIGSGVWNLVTSWECP